MIDFFSRDTHVLLNPRLDGERRRRMTRAAESVSLPGHVWLATSGTGGSNKLVALSKEALLASARAVNAHLEATEEDRWCCVLPTFHVGGLGIFARALLSGSRVLEMTWAPESFATDCERARVTLGSLVPAQVSDLVAARVRVPADLRAIVVGGGVLEERHRLAAVELGWPLLPSYGMTECSSQIATAAAVTDPSLKLLSHVEARTEGGRLAVRSAALLTGLLEDAEDSRSFRDPKVDGWYVTADRGVLHGDRIELSGRDADFLKIGGESVNLADLDTILAMLSPQSALVALPDERLGSVVHLVTADVEPDRVVAEFNARVLPFERIRGVTRVAEVPRTELGKLIRGEALRVALGNDKPVE